MKKLFSHELFWVTLFSFILITISMYPLYYHFKITPPGQVYLAQHNSILDFPMFISEIRQGQEGHLTERQRLTSEVQIGTWVHLYYLAIGWVTGPFHVSPLVVYHASRVIIGFLLLLTFYFFLKAFFKDKFTSLAVFFLTVFAGGFPRLKFDQGRFWLIDWPYMQFFSGYDVLRRVTFLPHGMMRDVLFLGVVIFWLKLWETKKLKYFWLSVLCGFFLGFFSPTHALVLYIVIFGLLILSAVRLFFEQSEKSKIVLGTTTRTIISLVISYILFTLPSSLYITWVFDNTVWKIVKDWEASQWFPIPFWEYALGTGPLFFLGIPAVLYIAFKYISSFCKKDSGVVASLLPRMTNSTLLKYYLLIVVPLFTLFFLFSPFVKTIGLLNFRFLGIPLQVFWGTLGGLTVVWLAKKAATFFCHCERPKGAWQSQNFVEEIAELVLSCHGKRLLHFVRNDNEGSRLAMTDNKYKIVLIVLCILVFLPTLPSYQVSLKTQKQEFTPPINFNIYPDKTLYAGFQWLEKNTKPEEIVFSDITLGNLIPAYSGNMVYVGHSVSTVNYEEKLKDVAKFYKTAMSDVEAKKFLVQRRIKYVIWSYDEHGYQGEPQKYASFLILCFANSEIQIYEVK